MECSWLHLGHARLLLFLNFLPSLFYFSFLCFLRDGLPYYGMQLATLGPRHALAFVFQPKGEKPLTQTDMHGSSFYPFLSFLSPLSSCFPPNAQLQPYPYNLMSPYKIKVQFDFNFHALLFVFQPQGRTHSHRQTCAVDQYVTINSRWSVDQQEHWHFGAMAFIHFKNIWIQLDPFSIINHLLTRNWEKDWRKSLFTPSHPNSFGSG